MKNRLELYNSVEVQLEVLSGCAFSCDGCHVDKNTTNKTTQHMYEVVHAFADAFSPWAVVLGSTDIFTAQNTLMLLNDIRFTELLKRFGRVVVNTTAAKINHDVLDALGRLGRTIGFNVVIPLTKMFNETYLRAIAGRVEELQRSIPDSVIHYQLNVIEGLKVSSYDDLNALYTKYFGTGVDYNLSFTRTETDREVYLSQFHWLRQQHSQDQVAHDGSLRGRHYDMLLADDRREHTIIFYDNAFYLVPIVYGDAIQIRERYRFKDYSDYQRLYDRLTNEQYEYITATDQCSSCAFLPNCVDRGVLAVMEDYAISECIMPREALLKVNRLD